MSKILKLSEAQEFVKRGVLAKNIEVGITNFRNDFFIDTIHQLNGDIRFIVTSLDEACKCNVNYRQITRFAGQPIERLLEAFDMGENKIIEMHSETNVMEDIVGKEEAEIEGIDLDEGMRIILHNDITTKMNNKILNVKYNDIQTCCK